MGRVVVKSQIPLKNMLVSNSGQVGIILLLITVVMLTVGISVVSRSTSDLNISNTSEQSNRALDAAESGVEQALSQDLKNYTPPTGGSGPINVNTQVSSSRSLQAFVDQGYTVGVDLTGVITPVTVQWAKESSCSSRASLVLTIFSTASPAVRRIYASANTCSHNDNFNAPVSAGSNGYSSSTTVTTAAGDYLMRIRPLYYSSDVQVTGNNLPVQAYTVTSSAQNTTGKETKVVQVDRTLPIPPSVFDYVLYSGTSITQ
jgi:hypothetical protein